LDVGLAEAFAYRCTGHCSATGYLIDLVMMPLAEGNSDWNPVAGPRLGRLPVRLFLVSLSSL